MVRKSKRTHLLLFLGAASTLGLLLTLTNPDRLPVGLVFLPIALMYTCLFIGGLYVYKLLASVQASFSSVRVTVFAAIFAAVPTALLLLRSINQLTFKDLFLICLLGAVVTFYASVLKLGKPKL